MWLNWAQIAAATVGGVASALVVISVQWLVRRYWDRWSKWPFKVGWGQVLPTAGAYREIRVKMLNLSSTDAHAMIIALDKEGNYVQGFDVYRIEDGKVAPNLTVIPAHAWKEFGIRGPNPNPNGPPQGPIEKLKIMAWFFTFEHCKEKIVPVPLANAELRAPQ